MDNADQKRYNDDLVQKARDILERIVATCAKEMEAEAVTLWLYDAEIHRFDLPIQYGLLDPVTFLDPRLRARTYGLAGRYVSGQTEAETVFYNVDGDTPISAFAIRERIRVYIAVQISIDHHVYGVLFVNYRQPNTKANSGSGRCREIARMIPTQVDLPTVVAALRHKQEGNQEWQDVNNRDRLERVALQTVVEFVGELIPGYSLAVWLRDPNDPDTIRLSVGVGITSRYLDGGTAHVGDTIVVSSVFRSERDAFASIRPERTDGFLEECAHYAGWQSHFCHAIKVREAVVGVLEVLSFRKLNRSFDVRCRETAHRAASILGVAIENFDRSRESEVLRTAAVAIGANPDVDRALDLVLKFACDLTGAEYAAILLPSANSNEVRVRKRSPMSDTRDPHDEYLQRRAQGDITAEVDVFEQLDPIDSHVDGSLTARFVAGVGIQIAGQPKGMLYVLTRRKRAFTLHDVHLLKLVATQASAGLGWIGMLFNPLSNVEEATARLTSGPDKLSTACEDIKSLGYDFVTIQRVNPEHGIVKTDWSCGLDDTWAGRSGHSLNQDPGLQDIQASMVLRAQEDLDPPIEAITGWDDRFDLYIYTHFRHDRLTRIFVPMMVFLTVEGKIDLSWLEREVLSLSSDDTQRDRIDARKISHRRVWRMRCRQGNSGETYKLVLGTVEVGYDDPKRTRSISDGEVRSLVSKVAYHACEIYTTTLTNVFNVIMRGAKQIAAADAATFHFNWLGPTSTQSNRGKYTYSLAEGITPSVSHTNAPRVNGLGRQAVEAKRALFMPDPDATDRDAAYRAYNEDLYHRGIRSSAAFPLILLDGRDGVLYLHFKHYRLITETDLQYVSFFVNRAKNAIALATSLASYQDQTAALDGLQNVTQTMAATRSDLLDEVAWDTLNVLAADVVTIYEVIDGTCRSKPATAGRLLYPDLMQTEVGKLDAPMNVLRESICIYAEDALSNDKLHPSRTDLTEKKPFVDREDIVSACAIPLMAANTVVGILFVNYRRQIRFDEKTKHMIDVLASSAALAITNLRSMERLEEMADSAMPNFNLDHALVAIKGLAEELLELKPQEELERRAKAISDRADIATSEFRSGARSNSLISTQFDIVELVKTVVSNCQSHTIDRVEFRLKVPKRLIRTNTMRPYISEVLSILVNNATDELMELARTDKIRDCYVQIHVKVIQPNQDKLIQIKVKDNGRGVPPSLGDPFGRGITGKHDLKTRGMGLFYARFLIERVGGTVELLPYRKKGGTCFTMTFPAQIPSRFNRTQITN